MKKVAGTLRLDLAQFRVDGRVRAVRLGPRQARRRTSSPAVSASTEVLKQGQYVPMDGRSSRSSAIYGARPMGYVDDHSDRVHQAVGSRSCTRVRAGEAQEAAFASCCVRRKKIDDDVVEVASTRRSTPSRRYSTRRRTTELGVRRSPSDPRHAPHHGPETACPISKTSASGSDQRQEHAEDHARDEDGRGGEAPSGTAEHPRPPALRHQDDTTCSALVAARAGDGRGDTSDARAP